MNRIPHSALLRAMAAAFTVILLGGCASLSKDGGFDAVQSAARERGVSQQLTWNKTEAEAGAARDAARKLLTQPLTPETAVQVALLNNRGLQAQFAELGISEADVVQAGRLRNPGFSFGRSTRADEVEIERTFVFDVLGLITMPLRTELERRRFELTQFEMTGAVLQLAADTRRAWIAAVAAQEAVKYMEQVRSAAETSAELARRMAAAGNFSKLDQAREQVFYAEVMAQLARTKQNALAEREKLTRLMGLWGGDIAFRLPERLPDLPKGTRDAADLEAIALKQRLDVQGALRQAEHIAASLGLVRATGFVNVIEVGYQRVSETGQPRKSGYEIELRLPIFDWGDARNARAEHTYTQAVNRAADTAIHARSEVREAYAAYRTAHDLARHYRDEIVPLRKRISEETLLRYNGMLIGVFELLADARQQVAAVKAYIDALRDYWIAESNLNLALTGKSPGALSAATGGMQAVADSAGAGH